MYRDGHGVVQDRVMAYVWHDLADINGWAIAASNRDRILKELKASERKLGLKLSKLCLMNPAKCPEYSDN